MVHASIITIGDELLIGQVIDTNSAWISQELNKIGVWMKRRIAVGDRREDIWQALDEEARQADIILITGGLGPTADDITKPLLCDYFGGKMVLDKPTLEHVTYLFEKVFKRPLPLLDRNRRQAEVPDVCTVLKNRNGTAPGMLFEKGGKIFISMPGVPHEMKGIMKDHVLGLLQKRFQLPHILHRTLLVAGIGESYLADRIAEQEQALPSHIKLAYLPNFGMVRLRLTGTAIQLPDLEKELERHFSLLKEKLADVLVTDQDEPLEQVVAKLLLERQRTLGTAESCTGGHIAQLITAHPGASVYFKGSVVSYSNEVKMQLLGVSPETLQAEGAVSEATVRQMVQGALAALGCDYALATSGIMGPGGGSAEKPVGLVWIAVGNQQQVICQSFQFRFDRARNIHLTATNALNMLRKFIVADPTVEL